MITVKDWMSKPVVLTASDSSVYDAVKLMNKHGIGSIIVSKDGKNIEGILTERDVLKRLIGRDIDPHKTPVSEVMTTKVITVDINASLLEISKIMTKKIVRHILVMEKGHIVGVVTSRDLLQLMAG